MKKRTVLTMFMIAAVLLTACKPESRKQTYGDLSEKLNDGTVWVNTEDTAITDEYRAIYDEAVGEIDNFDATPFALVAKGGENMERYMFLCSTPAGDMKVVYIEKKQGEKAQMYGVENYTN